MGSLRRYATRPVVRALVIGCLLFVASCALPNVGLLDESQVGDTPAYERFGNAIVDGELPYRDFYLEYPPGSLPVFVAPSLAGDEGYANRFKVLMLALGLALVVAVVACLAALGREHELLPAAVFVGVAPALLGPVVLINFDLWPTVLAAAALVMLVRERSAWTGALLGAGFAAKVFPIVLLPVALIFLAARLGRRAVVRCAAAFAVAAGAIVLPFSALAPGAIWFDITVAVRRPLQIESLGSSVVLAAHRLGLYTPTVNSDFNSQNLGGDLPSLAAAVSLLFALVALALVVVSFVPRARDPRALLLAAAAAVTAFVAFGKILSPQYMVWLVPFVAVTASWPAYVLGAGALALTQAWFPDRYGELVRLGDVSWVVLARNLVLVALFAWLLRALRRRPARAA